MTEPNHVYTSVEICAGAGGQALGLHNAKFEHKALIELDPDACRTLRANVNTLNCAASTVYELDLKQFSKKAAGLEPQEYNIKSLGLVKGEIDLLAGGVPCPPFSFAGKQLGADDERDLFPHMLDMVEALDPKAVMIENVRGLLEPEDRFGGYRKEIIDRLEALGYAKCAWEILEAQDFGVPQLRPRAVLVAMKHKYAPHFEGMPKRSSSEPRQKARKALNDTMIERFDKLLEALETEKIDAAEKTKKIEKAKNARNRWSNWQGKDTVAPTLVGGSKKHGGADLGPSRAKKAWAALGVNALGVADEEPTSNPERHLLRKEGPMLTVKQAALIQGFPEEWEVTGKKTAAYRQIGNAFPPPVAQAVAEQIAKALRACDSGEIPEPESSTLLGKQPELFSAS